MLPLSTREDVTLDQVYRNLIADAGAAAITHIGLVDETGTEITGGDPAYARKAVTWTTASDGTIRPNANIVFDIPAAVTVGGWRGYSAASGGTNYGGKSVTNEVFTGQGEYTLLASATGINHVAV
jgi:hypothetical protein